MRSPILDGFFPCGECREYVSYCKHYGRRPGRPPKEAVTDDPEESIRLLAIKAVERQCQGCTRKTSRQRVRPVVNELFTKTAGLQWDNLIVLCPRCFAFVRGFDIAAIANEPWAPPMLKQFVADRERGGLPL